MPNPYQAVDDVVVAQLREYAGLISVVPAARIHFQQEAVSAVDILQAYDNMPTIAIATTLSPENPFLSADVSESVLTYEINVLVPGANNDEIRAIQWQIRRAISHLIDYQDAAGDTLTGSQPSPYEWGPIGITQWSAFREADFLRAIATVTVSISASESAIRA